MLALIHFCIASVIQFYNLGRNKMDISICITLLFRDYKFIALGHRQWPVLVSPSNCRWHLVLIFRRTLDLIAWTLWRSWWRLRKNFPLRFLTTKQRRLTPSRQRLISLLRILKQNKRISFFSYFKVCFASRTYATRD